MSMCLASIRTPIISAKRWKDMPCCRAAEKEWLVLIKDWDINRQSVYRFKKPLFLPRGTVLHMRYVYDNSKANVRNPERSAGTSEGGQPIGR